MSKYFFLASILNIFLSLSLFAMLEEKVSQDKNEQFRLGLKYFKNKDYNEAKKWILAAANQNDPGAQYLLGLMHFYAPYGILNYNGARIKYFSFGGQYFPSGLFNLKQVKASDEVKKDFNEAKKWFLLAANQNHPGAQYYLGLIYFFGRVESFGPSEPLITECFIFISGGGKYTVESDKKEALKWFLLAGKQNHSEAQGYLKCMYFYDSYGTQNYEEALKWSLLDVPNSSGYIDAIYSELKKQSNVYSEN